MSTAVPSSLVKAVTTTPTIDQHYRMNEVLSVIHRDINADLSAKTLCALASYSEQHFHRLFKKVTGESLHRYVRRTRLEAAANQLMFSPNRPIQKIAQACGFLSLSSFSRAFKSVYHMTPGQWRQEERHDGGRSMMTDTDLDAMKDPDIKAAYHRLQDEPLSAPKIVMLNEQQVAYVRHQGYGRSISEPWQVLQAWCLTEGRSMDRQIGLHHSNPALVSLEQCRYVACVTIDKPIIPRGRINSVTIPGGLHAAFTLAGRYGDLLPYVHKMYQQWLPCSSFTAKTTPAFAVYHQNQFLSDDDDFKLTFYLPISLS